MRTKRDFLRSLHGLDLPAPKTLFVILLGIGGLLIFLAKLSTTPAKNVSEADQPRIAQTFEEEAPSNCGPTGSKLEPGPFQRDAEWRQQLSEEVEQVEKGETLAQALGRLGLDSPEARQILSIAGDLADLTKIKPGSEVTLCRDKKTGLPVSLEFTFPGKPSLLMIKTPTGYAASCRVVKPVHTLSAGGGSINTSLWGAAVKLYGLEPELVMSFADIFRYDVDFLTEVQAGDTFSLLYDRPYMNGQPVGPGRILAAEFVNKGVRFEAYYFEDEEGHGGYYDAKGRSLKKTFLKSPLQYRRISSYFSQARMHPILKYVRPHLAVDYAAPTGTPVETIGDGTIVFMGRKGGYGNFVEIRHNQTFVTTYAHLSAYASGLKKGQRVRQGQLIGYVGSTGLASGPHLDFRVLEKGQYIDPLSIKFQPYPPIDQARKRKFLAQAAKYRAEISRLMAARSSAAN